MPQRRALAWFPKTPARRDPRRRLRHRRRLYRFLSALAVGSAQIEVRPRQRVLVVGADLIVPDHRPDRPG